MADVAEFKSEVKPDWCPGCGDFGVLNSLQKACADLNLHPQDVMLVSGIGCSSNIPGFFNSYGMHTLHGRSIAVAQGAKLANQDMTVIAAGPTTVHHHDASAASPNSSAAVCPVPAKKRPAARSGRRSSYRLLLWPDP